MNVQWVRNRALYTVLPILLALLIFGSGLAVAGNAGKVAGTVKDSQTGEPVIGASVLIEGTTMGSATNVDGYYVILNVPPGKYNIVVSGVGYAKKTNTGVQVSIDLTTTLDVTLVPSDVQVEEMVVTAERPLVQKDLTAKTAVVQSEQIQALPVTEVSQVLNLQAGFVGGSLRGGRQGEVAYWIDGVPVTDAFNGSQVVDVNKSMVQELQLISGAFNAEYGQAMSGIVNIATKEGGSKFAGGLGIYGGDYLTNDQNLFPGTNKFNPVNIRNIEGNISGPVIPEVLTFALNGRYIYFDGWLRGIRRFNPQNISYTDDAGVFHLYRDASGRGDSSIVPMNWSDRKYAQGKLAWQITPIIKLTGNYIYDYLTSKPYNRAYFYNPEGVGTNRDISNTAIFQLSHTLGSRTFYTVGGSAFIRKFKYYLYADPHDPRYVHPKLGLAPDTYSFLTGGTDMNWFNRSTTTYLGKVDLSSQVTESHLLKAGVEYRWHKVFYESIQLLPIEQQQDIVLATASPYITTQIPPISSSNHDLYTRKPHQMSGYIQDKIEFKDLIVNVGVRWDYFQPNGYVLADPTDPTIYNPIKPSNRFFDYNNNGVQDPGEQDKTVADREAYWYVKAKAKSQISPRLGFSFPITDRGIVHFSYGHFFQIPNFELLYQNPFFKIGQGTGPQGVVGNADLNAEQTISGEIGVQQQMTDDIALDVTAYLRDIRNLTGTRGELISVFGGASSYSRYINSDYGYVKGIVLTMNKRFSGGLTATVDYTYQVARGTASDPQQAYNAIAGGRQPEVQMTPLPWDQRHTLNVTVSYTHNNWGLSAIGQYGSGQPYTPRASEDISALLTNSQDKPAYVDLDLRAFYEFTVNPFKFVVFTRVFNLFDIRNEIGVYNDTGRAGFTSDIEIARAARPSPVNTLEQWFTQPTFYSEPRRIEFGMNLEF